MHSTISFDDIDSITDNDAWDILSQSYNKQLYKSLKVAGFSNKLLVKAKGQYLYASDGTKILDATCGFGVNFFGHNDNRAIEVEKKYREENLINYSKTHPIKAQALLCNNLRAVLPEQLNNYYFGISGAETVEAAIKIALAFTKHPSPTILVAKGGYHGKTLATLSLTSFSKWRSKFISDVIPSVIFFEFGSIESLNDAINQALKNNRQITCSILETVQGGTFKTASEEFHKYLVDRMNNIGAVSIYDEIKVGLYRTGKLFGIDHYGVVPNILLMSKPIGLGIAPISILATSNYIFNAAYKKITDGSVHSSTFSGLGASCAIAGDLFHRIGVGEFTEKVLTLTRSFEVMLDKLSSANDVKFSGIGLVRGLIIPSKQYLSMKVISSLGNMGQSVLALSIMHSLYNKSILTYFSPTEPNVIHIEPNICFQPEDFNYLEHALNNSIEESPIARIKNVFI